MLLSDARANIARNGQPGRELATSDALASARRLRALGLGMLMVDTSASSGRGGGGAAGGVAGGVAGGAAGRGPSAARLLADALQALYLPLPQVQAAQLSQAVRALAASGGGSR